MAPDLLSATANASMKPEKFVSFPFVKYFLRSSPHFPMRPAFFLLNGILTIDVIIWRKPRAPIVPEIPPSESAPSAANCSCMGTPNRVRIGNAYFDACASSSSSDFELRKVAVRKSIVLPKSFAGI